ncbi:conserved hypothetical protein [Leishmania major strain Friedlin]|uniref:Coiled-coil domain-containing protein n=1 Tax=Leishmania major TaxID=5664 RepID=Q4QGA2_LEIMA|nr:conserved hypothetical protein [Leishmania major strain Friedlin]CAG9570955.1 Protein_of_unknown_function_(DUF1014)_-_putative [Leishmania major strain Friedlin]CAJ02571.1 conserved hypothetical protein [Leishmania major strain Friedlin]|eukprot:XP_001681796.1 conserved hypothetical protein [Leishmania major strain Friedlin]
MPSGPKNNKYTNRHSEEARLRDEERRIDSRAAREAAKEDARWSETDPKVLKKMDKKREMEQKQEAKATRDAEKREQLEEEEREMNVKVPKKVAQRQIQKDLAKMLADYDKERNALRGGQHGAVAKSEKREEAPLPSGNVNRERGVAPHPAADQESNTIKASGTVADVVAALEKGGNASGAAEIPDNRHIGKRAKMLYKAFHAEHLEQVKEEKPGLRRTQYNDIIWEMWQKSPTNPFVMRSEKIAHERLEAERRWMEGDSDGEDEEEEEFKNGGKCAAK